AIRGQGALAGRLSGSMRGEVRGLANVAGPDGGAAALRDGRVSGKLRVDLTPSRFRGQDLSSASFDLGLAQGEADLRGDIASGAGRLDVAGRARPFDARPAFDVDRARFTDVDLAAWTSSAALRSRLSGSLTAHAQSGGASGPGTTLQAKLHLDPSTLGGAALPGGDVRTDWSGDHGQMTAALLVGRDTLSADGAFVVRDRVPVGHAELSIPFAAVAAMTG